MKKRCFSWRKIFDKKNIGSRSRSWSRILKVSVSEGVVSVSNGKVLVLVSVSDDSVSVSVSFSDEAKTPSLVGNTCHE